MNTPHSLPSHDIYVSETPLLSDDWNLTGAHVQAETLTFDGKIIARMPDLGGTGSNTAGQSVEKPKYPSARYQAVCSVASDFRGKLSDIFRVALGNRQQFFQRVSVFGGAFLICGIGILFLEHSDKTSDTDALNVADVLPKDVMPKESGFISPDTIPIAAGDSVFSSDVLPKTNSVVAESGIPVADISAVQDSLSHSSAAVVSAEPSPTADSYSPWNTPAKQPAPVRSEPAPEVAAVYPPVEAAGIPMESAAVATTAASNTVTMSPMTPIVAVPVSVPHSMPVSPYERQLLVAQTHTSAPVQTPPIDPFLSAGVNQPVNSPVAGMVPMHGRIEAVTPAALNTVQNVPPQTYVPAAYPPPAYYPAAPQQQGLPQQNPGQIPQDQHGRYGQYNQYASPQNRPSQSLPIPSGVSKLPQQNGYAPQVYPQTYEAAPMQSGNYYQNAYPNTPPGYRRVY